LPGWGPGAARSSPGCEQGALCSSREEKEADRCGTSHIAPLCAVGYKIQACLNRARLISHLHPEGILSSFLY